MWIDCQWCIWNWRGYKCPRHFDVLLRRWSKSRSPSTCRSWQVVWVVGIAFFLSLSKFIYLLVRTNIASFDSIFWTNTPLRRGLLLNEYKYSGYRNPLTDEQTITLLSSRGRNPQMGCSSWWKKRGLALSESPSAVWANRLRNAGLLWELYKQTFYSTGPKYNTVVPK